jgi:hypothetical protein
MLHARAMDCEFIVEDDETATAPHLSGWETVVFELGDADDNGDDDVTEGLEELIVALYF